MPFIETDNTRLFYQDWGTGKPVLFIHGWCVGAGMWEYQTTALAEEGLRCIAYDQRGCGRSDDPGRGFDYDTLADDLAAMIDHLDLRDVVLVGHSMGGGVIAQYFHRHGAHRIAQAVLIATTTPYLRKSEDNPEGIDAAIFDNVIAQLKRDRPQYIASLAPAFLGEGLPGCNPSPEMTQWVVNLVLQASPRATIEMARTNSEADQRAVMASITVPTLLIHGDADAGNPVELTSCKSAELIPRARLKIYENAEHGLILSHKDQLNQDLLEFIQR
ncbi:arylesterase [Capsulimonas corticalis]|uniref:Arylesterase n=1 Tax=Capsulimonas corticalis TaxID=2219043 RepID=A0A402CUB4_9BACT|nr:alpha/beta hydrolase [Capsulimonas corticalis]BDI28926.1 arylesterase [Capsulimonas corticalis]